MFETAREHTLTKRNSVCSMITSSENVTPMILLRQWILHAIVRSKSTRIFIPKTIVICDTSMMSVNVRVLLKKDNSQVGIKHSYSPFGCKIPCLVLNAPNQSLFQISKLQII